MKDSTKKRLIIAGLAAVCVLLIFGISRVLYKEPVQELPEESKTTEEMELVVDTEKTEPVQKETESTEETKELVIETETENGMESGKQEIQQTPEKTEDEKPEEPPALTEDADTTKPDTPPEYEEPEETKTPADDTPKPEIPRMEWYMWKDSDGYLMRVPVRERMRMICMRTEIR